VEDDRRDQHGEEDQRLPGDGVGGPGAEGEQADDDQQRDGAAGGPALGLLGGFLGVLLAGVGQRLVEAQSMQ
jgi:hypothetical protein